MKRNWKWKIIGILIAVFSLCLLGGCNLRESLQDKKDKYNIVAQITYHANLKDEASIGDKNEKSKTLYYTENSPALEIKHKNDSSHVTASKESVVLQYNYNKYKLLGWFEPLLDSNGEIQKDANDNVILKDTPFDFSTRLQKDDSYELYADWERLEMIIVKLVCEEDAVLYSSADKNKENPYTNGSVLREYAFNEEGERTYITDLFDVKDGEYTFTEFYKDTDVSNSANVMHEDDRTCWPMYKTEGQDCTIYAHYVKGDYEVVKRASDVKTFFTGANKSSNAYYLLCDIDCASLEPVRSIDNFNATFIGNGHTISNLTVTKSDVTKVAMFGGVGAKARMENVTFENVTANYSLSGKAEKAEVYWLFTSCNKVESFENVTFTGATLNITKASKTRITNIETTSGGIVMTNYLYGNATLDTDYAIDVAYTTPVVVDITVK